MNSRRLSCWLSSVMCLNASLLQAADQWPAAYGMIASQSGVPVDVLYAVALAESGHRYQDNAHPWPWALNIDGESVWCQTQQEAVAIATRAIDAGKSVDLGVMQINWSWHRHRFDTIHDALTPLKNVAVGASILSEQFERATDWWDAVGRYHAPGQDEASLERAARYRKRVHRHWQRLSP